MDDMKLEKLDKMIHEALDLIETLRAENSELKSELGKASKSLDDEKNKIAKKGLPATDVKTYKEDLRKFQNDRKMIKQKIRNIIKKIEGIQLDEEKVQKDLFAQE